MPEYRLTRIHFRGDQFSFIDQTEVVPPVTCVTDWHAVGERCVLAT